MKHSPAIDTTRLNRALLTIFLVAVSVVLAYLGFSRNLPALGLLIPLVAVASWLIGRPASLFILTLFVEGARITLPGIPSALGLLGLLQVLLLGWMLLDISVRHQKQPFAFKRNPDTWVLLFAGNLILLMVVRGSGFAMLGSSTYGGTAYVSMLLALLFYFAAIRVQFTDRQVKILLWLILAGTMIPMLVQIAGYFLPGSIDGLAKVVNVNVERMVEEQERESEAVVRWNYFSFVAYALLPIIYVLYRKKLIRAVLILLAFVLVAMTGSRSRILYVAVMTFLASVYFSKNRLSVFIYWGLAGLLFLGFLMITAPVLPGAVQRAVSFIPFIPVDPSIAEHANLSGDWRVELWKNYCIPNIPRYLLIGRGLAHDITGFAWLQAHWYGSAEFYYYMGRYHSGPLTLLLDLGLPGFMSFTLFFLLVLSDAIKTVKQYASEQSTVASRYYIYLTLLMAYQMFSYYFIFGDVRSSLFRLLMTAAQLRILKKNFLMESPSEAGMPEVRSQTSGVRRLWAEDGRQRSGVGSAGNRRQTARTESGVLRVQA